MPNIYSHNLPTGGLDFDNNSRDIEATDYRYSLNIRNGVAYVKKKSGATFVKGNKLIPKIIYTYGTPTGNSKTIGSYEDKQTNTIIFMVRNANGQSGIYRYYPQLIDATNPFGEIHQVAYFNFGWKANTQITSINTISGKSGELIYWCDNVRGRKINLTKAEIVGKLKTWTCYFPKTSTRFQQLFYFVIQPMGSTTPITTLTIDTTAQTQIKTIGELFAYLADAINADPVCSQYITAEACDCKLNLIEKFANMVDVFFLNQDIKTVPTNWYGQVFTERMFDEAKYPSLLSPLVNFGVNPDKQFNNVKNQVWQFRINLFYDDFEKSVLSPFTQVPVNELVNDGLQVQNFNYLNINFNDRSIPDNLTLVNRISVTARSGNTGVEQEVAQLEICDFLNYDYGLGRWFCDYDFYNDTIANVIDTAYAIKIQDGVPIQNNAQDIVQNRLVKGGILSGDDGVDCLDIAVKQEFDAGDDVFFTISGQMRIMHLEDSNNGNLFHGTNIQSRLGLIYKYPPVDASNPTEGESYPQWGGIPPKYFTGNSISDRDRNLDQYLPMGGFVVYAAGTDHWTLTKQELYEINSAGVPQFGSYLPTAFGTVLNANPAQTLRDFLTTTPPYHDEHGVLNTFSLRVKPGKYIIRFASHWCSFGDVLGKGPMYDMYNGRSYQTTSTHIYSTIPIDPNTGLFLQENWNVKEIEVTVTNGDVFIGEFLIEDCRAWFPKCTNTMLSGYVVDGSGLGSANQALIGAPRIEGQGIKLRVPPSSGSGALSNANASCGVTDHNGYFYTSFNWKYTNNINNLIMAWIVYNNQATASVYTSFNTNPYGGDSILNSLVSNTLSAYSFTITPGLATGGLKPFAVNEQYQLLFVLNDITLSNQIKTHISGSFVDANSNPISGALVIFGQTGRIATTDISGLFSILVYANANVFISPGNFLNAPAIAQRYPNDLIAYFNDQGININNNVQIISFPDFTTYNGTNPYLTPLNFILVANYAPFGKGLKRGGTYQIGIRYQDEAGRECSVITNQSSIIYIPFITEDLNIYFPSQYPVGTYLFGKPTLTVTLNFKPPIWATSYNIMLTKNQYETGYLQWVANQITYVSNIGYSTAENAGASTTLTENTIDSGNIVSSISTTTPISTYNPPVVSSYSAGDATNIYISLYNFLDYQKANPDSILSYTYKAGDRLRLIADENGNKYRSLYEFEVTGYDTEQNCIIVRNRVSVPELKSGVLFEVLHPRLNIEAGEQLFYEVGESFLCTAPNTPNNDHSVNPIVLTCGDAYWRRRQYIVNDTTNYIIFFTSYIIEDANLSDFFVSDSWDIGRIGVSDPFFKRTYKETDIIVSNPYITDSNLNGFNSFEALNRKSLDKQYGAIQRLIMLGNVLHVICTNKSISDYIGQRVLSESKQLNGPVAIANDFLGTERAQIKDIGTQHPASVYRKDGYIYGLDALRFIMWRDANDGMTEISKSINSKGVTTMQSYFKELCAKPLWSVTSGIDKYYNEYIITIFQKEVAYNIVPFTEVLEGGSFAMFLNHPVEDFGIQDGDDVIVDGILPNGTAVTLYGTAGVTVDNHGTLIINGTNTYVQLTQARVSFRGAGVTIAWQEDKNRWTTFYSFQPECYGTLGALLYSYNNGELWIHDQNDVRNNFYGTQYGATITPVFNARPDLIKVWLSMTMESIQADGGNNWSCEITNDYGQKSIITKQAFRKKERQFAVDFKRDTTTTNVAIPILNGRVLRSESLQVTMNSDYTGDVILRMLMALTMTSERTGK